MEYKKYRIIYWFNSVTTDFYISACSVEEAERVFRRYKGDKKIIRIEEV